MIIKSKCLFRTCLLGWGGIFTTKPHNINLTCRECELLFSRGQWEAGSSWTKGSIPRAVGFGGPVAEGQPADRTTWLRVTQIAALGEEWFIRLCSHRSTFLWLRVSLWATEPSGEGETSASSSPNFPDAFVHQSQKLAFSYFCHLINLNTVELRLLSRPWRSLGPTTKGCGCECPTVWLVSAGRYRSAFLMFRVHKQVTASINFMQLQGNSAFISVFRVSFQKWFYFHVWKH